MRGIGNALVIHGGGPTAVINASLYGLVDEAKRVLKVDHIWGAIGGVAGLLDGNFCELGEISQDRLRLLLSSPASAIGTGRDALQEEDYCRLACALGKYGVHWVFMNGGNGTMDACYRLGEACREVGVEVVCLGVPKTMDNDICATDHAPGYGSAARYVAGSVAEVACDVAALPIHVVVIEAMGRSAGWVAASSALANDCPTGGADLIYMPERAFDEDNYLNDAQRLIDTRGGGVVVASEGLRYADGTPIVDPVMTVGRATYYGGVSAKLANLIIAKLGYKARAEKPGLLGRASIAWQSVPDREEAELVGRTAVRAAAAGEDGVMVGLERMPGAGYAVRTTLVPLSEVRLAERLLPDEYINERGNGVTDEFKNWARPLIGAPLPEYVSFR